MYYVLFLDYTTGKCQSNAAIKIFYTLKLNINLKQKVLANKEKMHQIFYTICGNEQPMNSIMSGSSGTEYSLHQNDTVYLKRNVLSVNVLVKTY